MQRMVNSKRWVCHFFQQIVSVESATSIWLHRRPQAVNLLLDSKCNAKVMSEIHFYNTTSRSPNYAVAEVLSEWPDAGSKVDLQNTLSSLWRVILYSTFGRQVNPSWWLHDILKGFQISRRGLWFQALWLNE